MHAHLHQPVHIVGSGLVVGRLLHQLVYLLLGVALGGVQPVHLHPLHELRVVYDILLERVAYLVDKVYMHIGIIGIHLTTTLVDGHEHRLDATRGLRHQRRGSRRCDSQTGDVAAAIFYHIVVKGCISLLDTLYEGVLGLTLGVVYLEGATLLGHLHTRAIGVQRQRLVHLHAEVGGLLRTIAQSHGGYHVTLGSDTYSRTATLRTLGLDLLPQVHLGTLHLHRLGVGLHLLHDEVYLLQLQVYDVVHQSLGHLHVLLEQLIVEVGILREGFLHVAVQVDAQQTAGVVRTKGYLATRIGAHGTEAQVGIAVGDALPEDGVPEQHTRLSTLPGVVHNLLPQRLR